MNTRFAPGIVSAVTLDKQETHRVQSAAGTQLPPIRSVNTTVGQKRLVRFWEEPRRWAYAVPQEDPLLHSPAFGRKTSFTSSQSYVTRLSDPIKNFTIVYRDCYSLPLAMPLAKCESFILLQL